MWVLHLELSIRDFEVTTSVATRQKARTFVFEQKLHSSGTPASGRHCADDDCQYANGNPYKR
jgi:hypothetical protein